MVFAQRLLDDRSLADRMSNCADSPNLLLEGSAVLHRNSRPTGIPDIAGADSRIRSGDLDSLSERKSAINASYDDTKRLARLAAAKEGALIEGARQLTIALSVLPATGQRDQPRATPLSGI